MIIHFRLQDLITEYNPGESFTFVSPAPTSRSRRSFKKQCFGDPRIVRL